MKNCRGFLCALACALASFVSTGYAIPFVIDGITTADAVRPVRGSMDGVDGADSDLMAVIEYGNPRSGGGVTNNLRTFFRNGTNWNEVGILPAPGWAFSVDVSDCQMVVGQQGGARLWTSTCNPSKPSWVSDTLIPLSNAAYRVLGADLDGSRLALLVDRASSVAGIDQSVYLYDLSGTTWVYRAEIGVAISNATEGVTLYANTLDLDGDRMAIAMPLLNTIQIHEKDEGGVNAWGVVAAISNAPAGMTQLGYSLALDGTRLAASAVEAASQQPTILVYSKDTGGVDRWGYAGTLLDGQAGASAITLDSDGTRLAALSLPKLDSTFITGRQQSLWVFGDGAGPGGWALERAQLTGQFAWSLDEGINRVPLMAMRPAISGTRIMLGLPGTNGVGRKSGWEVTVYEADTGGAGQWGEEGGIRVTGAPLELGSALDMDGPFLVAGMPEDDGSGTQIGSAYVWYLHESGTNTIWYPVTRLVDEVANMGSGFGYSVAIEATSDLEARVAVGAPFELGGQGAVYLFDVSVALGQQTLQHRIALPLPAATNHFGRAVALDGDYLAVGAPIEDTALGVDAGKVYLFEKDLGGTNNWGCRVTNAAPTAGLFYGARVDIEASKLAAARWDQAELGPAVFVYDRDEGGADNWGLMDTITPPPDAPDSFGFAIDFVIGGRFLLIGAIDQFSPSTNGAAYYYGLSPSETYDLLFKIDDPAGDGPSFGYDVESLDFAGVLVGAPESLHGGVTEIGTARLFDFSVTGGVTNVTLLATLAGTNAVDRMGAAVAGVGIYGVASAPGDDRNGSDAGRVAATRVGDYERWAASQSSSAPDFASRGLPWDDYDGDGDANLVEFALGTDPTDPASTQKLVMFPVRNGLGTLLMAWEEPDVPYSVLGLNYNMQAGSDMKQWLSISGSTTVEDGKVLRLYDTSVSPRFFRLAPRYPDVGSFGVGGGGGGGGIGVLE